MKTFWVVKKIGSNAFDLICDTDKGAAAHALMLNATHPRRGYLVVPHTEESLRLKREMLEKQITDLRDTIEDISAVLGDREPSEVLD